MKKNILIFGIINTVLAFSAILMPIYSSINTIVLGIAPLVLSLIVAFIAAFFFRKNNPKDASFRNLFITVFGGLSIGILVGTLLIICFFFCLSEETKLILENQYLENQFTSLSHLSNSIAFMDALEKASDDLFNLEYQIVGSIYGIVLNVLFAAVVALCMKREYSDLDAVKSID